MPEEKSRPRRWSRPERRLALGAVVCVLASLIASHFVFSASSSLRHQAAKDRVKTAQETAAWRLGQSIEAKAALWEHRLSAAKTALPFGEDQPGFVSDMTTLSSTCGASWSSSSWSEGTQPSRELFSWSVQITVTGTEPEALCVVEGLANLPRAVSVTNVSLTWETYSEVQAALSLTVYSRAGGGA